MKLTYINEHTMYIHAGKKRLAEERATTLVELKNKAMQTGLPEDAQAANDFEEQCIRFERKLHDLELTRMVSIQMSPQIRLVQNNDTMMAEKIQTVIMNTIPLWKSQMVIALGIEHSRQAMEAGRMVTDMTNELLKKNAEALRQATVDITREAERGIVDIETLTHTNEQLIQTLDEVQQIQKEGREKRAAAEEELGRIEGELKTKLINMGQ
ncbi:MAG: toxic anion resistance protein, partial [Clostridia bacterium]|nr:toxic anion resistance protein [Clostridia bacterium]